MKPLKLEDIVDIDLFQKLQDEMNRIYPFPSAIIDNDGNILTATAWQDICTRFHRIHPVCKKECVKSDKYILEHISEANPAVVYTCPHGLTDTAIPIIIGGKHLANFFTGQFFLRKPDIDFFERQAERFGFDKKSYIKAVEAAPVMSEERMRSLHSFISSFTKIIVQIAESNLRQKEDTERIRESEEKYRGLFESMRQGVFYQATDGSLIDVNKAALDIFGLTRDEFLGRTSHHVEWDVINEKGRSLKPEEHPSMMVMKSLKPVKDRIIGVFNRKKGHYKWLVVNAMPSFVEGTKELNSVMVTLHDITHNRALQSDLESSSEFSRRIISDAMDGFWLVDNRGRILDVNDAYCSMIGYTREELTTMSIKDIEAVESLAEIEDRITRIRNSGPMQFESRHKRKDGGEVEVEISVNYLPKEDYTFVFIRDITQRKESEKMLMESELKFRTIFEDAPIGMLLLSPDGKFLQVNSSFCEMLEYSSDQLLSMTFRDITFKEDIENSNIVLTDLIKGPVRSASLEKRYVTRSGRIIACLISTTLHMDSLNNPKYFVTHMIDITEQRNADEKLRSKISELERFNMLTVDRELKMIELKREVNSLLGEFGRDIKYTIPK